MKFKPVRVSDFVGIDKGEGVFIHLYKMAMHLALRYYFSTFIGCDTAYLTGDDLVQECVNAMAEMLKRLQPEAREEMENALLLEPEKSARRRMAAKALCYRGEDAIKTALGIRNGHYKTRMGGGRIVSIEGLLKKPRDQNGQDYEEIVAQREELWTIAMAVLSLKNPRQRMVAMHRWGIKAEQLDLSSIGARIGITKQGVHQIERVVITTFFDRGILDSKRPTVILNRINALREISGAADLEFSAQRVAR